MVPALSFPGGAVLAQVSGNGVGSPFELSFWESVANSNDIRQLEAYLAQYPQGTFSMLAKVKIAALSPRPAPAAGPSEPVPAPVSAPMAAVATTSQPAPTAAVVGAPAAGQPASLLEQLAAVGQSGPSSTTALYTVSGPVPPRPDIPALALPTLPDHFCSAVERNQFHDTVYVPAVANADRNNNATIAHLRDVQTLHEKALAANDVAGANALAREAITYKPVADQAYSERTAMTDLFSRMMAVPVTGC